MKGTLDERVTLIRGIHRRLNLDTEIVDGKVSGAVDRLLKDDDVLSGLEKATRELRTTAHEIKISVLRAFLSQLAKYGFLRPDVDYVDWCSGRGELAYSLAHLIGPQVVRSDRRFSKKNLVEKIFPCTKEYGITKIPFDLKSLTSMQHVPTIPESPKGKVAYVGTYCCGSLADLIVRYAELQQRMPDFIGILPCHHEKMEFELSNLASKISLSRDIFNLLRRAVEYLQLEDGYRAVARKAMDIIDYHRALNLRHLGYDARVVRIYPHSVSPFNNMLVGVKS
ncbi:hypothetical protein J4234_01710 [Candidatus Woesearchaeota archaeon]|nr:hypothetical protein [Candidatus Woesearchaeota archaeon]